MSESILKSPNRCVKALTFVRQFCYAFFLHPPYVARSSLYTPQYLRTFEWGSPNLTFLNALIVPDVLKIPMDALLGC